MSMIVQYQTIILVKPYFGQAPFVIYIFIYIEYDSSHLSVFGSYTFQSTGQHLLITLEYVKPTRVSFNYIFFFFFFKVPLKGSTLLS